MHMYCSIVKITDLVKEDAGTYEVVAKNREGEATNTLVLNVTEAPKKAAEAEPAKEQKEAPQITKPLTPTVCRVGEAVRMDAVITGKPQPRIRWQRNGQDLVSGGGVKILSKDGVYSVVIDRVTQSDDAEYSVRAENEVGSAQTSANICVQGKNPILKT